MAGVGAFAAGPYAPASRRRPAAIALLILAAVVLSIATVLALQAVGYAPCELCLKERVPFYIGTGLAAAAVPVAARAPAALARTWFGLIAALFLASAALGAYHAGVEWALWPGPTDCTGTPARAATNADFLHQLQTTHVVRCDSAAIRILGLSLAGWNVLASLLIAAVAGMGAAATRDDAASIRPAPRRSDGP